MKVLTFLLATVAGTLCLAAETQTISCFGIDQARPTVHTGTHPLQASNKSYTKTATGGLKLTASGKPSSQALWRIPLNLSIPVTFDVAFSVQFNNIKNPGNRPTLYILLTPDAPGSSKLPVKIPVFLAEGVDGKELGTKQFANPEGYRVDGLYVDIHNAGGGNAALEISRFDITHESRLPTAETLTDNLAKWSADTPRFERQPDKIYALRLGKVLKACDGVDLGGNPQPALIKRLKPVNAFYLNHVDIPLAGTHSLWESPGFFNARRLDDLIQRASAADTALILTVDLSSPPPWWTEKGGKHSDLNPAWLDHCKQALRLMLARLAETGNYRSVAGVILTLSPGPNAAPLPQRTRHPATAPRFRDWLKEQYFDEAALQKAWTSKTVTFKTAGWTPIERWPKGLIGPLLPTTPRPVRDSIHFYFESWDQFAVDLNTFIKGLTDGNCQTGFWAHPHRYKRFWDNRHYHPASLKSALEAEAVDFIEIPDWEPDFLPSIPWSVDKPTFARLDLAGYTQPQQLRELLRLAYCSPTQGIDGYVLETKRLISLSTPDLGTEFKRFRTVRKLSSNPSTRVELAFVVDPHVFDVIAPVRDMPVVTGSSPATAPTSMRSPLPTMHYLYETAQKLWPYSGMPYDIISIDQLNEDMPYRVLVFFHCINMTPERVKKVDGMKSGGRTLIWSWADAVMTEGKFSISAVKDITGIGRKLSPGAQRLYMLPTAKMKGFLDDQRLETTIGGVSSPFEHDSGTGKTFSPSFSIHDPDVTVLATHIDTKGAALGLRDFFRSDAVYSSSPAINPEIIRAAALNSDAHVYYYKNDPVRITDNLIVIHARTTGKRSLTFDDKTPLYEVFSDLALKTSRSHQFNVMKGKTYLFYRGDKAGWTPLMSK